MIARVIEFDALDGGAAIRQRDEHPKRALVRHGAERDPLRLHVLCGCGGRQIGGIHGGTGDFSCRLANIARRAACGRFGRARGRGLWRSPRILLGDNYGLGRRRKEFLHQPLVTEQNGHREADK